MLDRLEVGGFLQQDDIWLTAVDDARYMIDPAKPKKNISDGTLSEFCVFMLEVLLFISLLLREQCSCRGELVAALRGLTATGHAVSDCRSAGASALRLKLRRTAVALAEVVSPRVATHAQAEACALHTMNTEACALHAMNKGTKGHSYVTCTNCRYNASASAGSCSSSRAYPLGDLKPRSNMRRAVRRWSRRERRD